jgi:hypothetical protein
MRWVKFGTRASMIHAAGAGGGRHTGATWAAGSNGKED